MKHLYIIVEGQTELEFVKRLLIPYLMVNRGLKTNIQCLQIDMKGGGHGFNDINHFVNTITPLLYYKEEPFITTMIDYYGINSAKKLPDFEKCNNKTDVVSRILCLEECLNNVVQNIKPYDYFIPNLTLHETETFLFSDPIKGFALENEQIKKEVLNIVLQYPNIEDINNTPEGAPSKRLENIFKKHGKNYNKGIDAIDIAELTGLDKILEKCPKFNNWVEKIICCVGGS